jgi:hypothetical protein
MRNSAILQELCAGNPDCRQVIEKSRFSRNYGTTVEFPRQDSFRIADHTPPRNSPPTSRG